MQQPKDLDNKFAATVSEILEKAFLTKISEKDTKHRDSCPEVFCKVDVLKNFERFTGKHLCQWLLFSKVACWISAA